MKKNRVFLSILIVLYFTIFFSKEAFSQVNTFQLSNGLKVILAPLDNVEAACVMLYHLTGIRDDPLEIKGASLLYETLMSARTQNLDSMDRILYIKKLGGSSNCSVNYDNSVFYQLVPYTEINNALWFESERISSLRLEDHYIDVLKNNIYRRFYHLTNSSVHFRASNWVKSKVFEGTDYQLPVYGDLEKIRFFNNQKIKNIYDNFRNLSDIIMVISGKFDILEVKKTIRKRFDGLVSENRKDVKKNYKSFNPRTEYVYKNWLVENLQRPFFNYGIRAPSKSSYDHIYFNFIRYYLLDKRVSKLERMINRRNIMDVNISHEFTNNIEVNALVIKVDAESRISLEKARYILTRELAAFTGKPKILSNSGIKMVKSLMEIDFKKSMRNLKERSLLLAENCHLTGGINFAEKYLDRLNKMTVYDIIRISKKYLKKENQVVLNVYKK